jgi:hypothetical protein
VRDRAQHRNVAVEAPTDAKLRQPDATLVEFQSSPGRHDPVRALSPSASESHAALIGRGREMARITTQLGESRDGRGAALALQGEPGIGNTPCEQCPQR